MRRRREVQQDEVNRERQFRIRRHLSVEGAEGGGEQPAAQEIIPANITESEETTPTVTEETNTNDQVSLCLLYSL